MTSGKRAKQQRRLERETPTPARVLETSTPCPGGSLMAQAGRHVLGPMAGQYLLWQSNAKRAMLAQLEAVKACTGDPETCPSSVHRKGSACSL